MLRRRVTEGCLPVATDAGRGIVVLSPLADLGFPEERYDRALLERGRRRPAHLMPVDEFVGAVAGLVAERPPPRAGVVAHVGRCGSTLLANLLGLRADTLVLKEPGFLHSPDRPLLAALLDHCRLVAAERGTGLVVKPTSWTGPALLEAAAPAARWLLLWRDPEAVVASELDRPPPWAAAANSRAELARRVDPVPDDAVARYATHWLDVVRAFLPAPDVRFLGYPRLAADKASAVRAAQSWFGLPEPDRLPHGFADEAGRYSKAPGATRFDPAGGHRRGSLTGDDAARVGRLTAAAVAALRGLDRSRSLCPGPAPDPAADRHAAAGPDHGSAPDP
jgi:hypothetical protein